MFPIQSLGVECEVCLSHAGGSKVTKPIFSKVESAILLFRIPSLGIIGNSEIGL